jgi:hypothetical protein
MPSIENVEFDEFIARRGAAGRAELAGALRLLALQQAPELATRLEGLPDQALLEPRAFSLFWQGDSGLSLSDLLFGRLPPAARPSLEVPGTQVELVREADPLLVSCLRHGTGPDHEPELVDPAPYTASIAEALSVIRACAPRFHEELLTGLRAIVLFRHPSAHSFAALAAHGAVFLNVRWPAGIAYFVDELSHQGGHVVFTAATVRRQDFFSVHPDTPLSELTDGDDSRSVYDALHGVYTEHVCCRVMRAADEGRLLRGTDAVELYGRLSFVSGRYGVDVALQAATLQRWASPLGRELHACFADDCARLQRQRPDLRRQDLSTQPYEFDAALFSRQNPHVTPTIFDHLHSESPR